MASICGTAKRFTLQHGSRGEVDMKLQGLHLACNVYQFKEMWLAGHRYLNVQHIFIKNVNVG